MFGYVEFKNVDFNCLFEEVKKEKKVVIFECSEYRMKVYKMEVEFWNLEYVWVNFDKDKGVLLN